MTRLRHLDNLSTVRFVTFSCHRRHPLLTSDFVKLILIDELRVIRERHRLRIHGYVIMPEHVHLVLWLPDEVKLGQVIGELKSLSARRILMRPREQGLHPEMLMVFRHRELQSAFWQPRCYDHNCRSMESVKQKIDYCHKNPVTRGLVSHPRDWKWSSHNWYDGVANIPLSMDQP
jgi:putative transposase